MNKVKALMFLTMSFFVHSVETQGNKENMALLIIDMQNDFVLPDIFPANQKAFDIVPKIEKVLSFARSKHWPVFHIVREYRDDGSNIEKIRIEDFKQRKRAVPHTFGCEIVAALKPLRGEYRVVKWRFSGFMHTELDLLLRRLKIHHLVICGTQLPNCVRATIYDAVALDYDVTVIKDAVAARTEEVHETNIRDIQNLGIACQTWNEFSHHYECQKEEGK
jgi:nicotinamidase-related amidase